MSLDRSQRSRHDGLGFTAQPQGRLVIGARTLRAAAGAATLAAVSACSGTASIAPSPTSGVSSESGQRLAKPQVEASGAPWVRVGVGAPQLSRVVRETGAVLLDESFAGSKTPGHRWIHSGAACLTAGDPFTPKLSIPGCSGSGQVDRAVRGALELNPPENWDVGLAEWHEAVPTARGLSVKFTLYSFDGTLPGADGTLLFFSDGSKQPPRKPSGDGGNLGYMGAGARRMKHAYLGVGFDEYGNFSKTLRGGPGFIPETVALGGAASLGHHYLGGVVDGSGKPASLPFDFDRSDQTGIVNRQGSGITIEVLLTPAGLVEVALDAHDGRGLVTYLSTSIVGVAGQPPVPPTVFIGFIGSTGGLHNRHEIADLTISTLLGQVQ